MIRNLKALGLALVAVFAMSAMAAASASAEDADFAASGYPAHITATETSEQTFTSSVGKLTCVNGGTQAVEGTGVLEEESPELTTGSIQYTNCHATVLKLPVTVDMNGCDYLFTAGTMVGAGKSEGTVHIECGAKPIEITVFANGSKHAAGEPGCIIDVDTQTPTSGSVIYENSGGGVKVTANNVVVHSTKTAVGALCSAGADNSTYNGSFVAKGTENSLEITGTP